METLQVISIIISGLTIITMLIAFKDRIFNSGSKERNIQDRVSTLEEKSCEVANDIKMIKENHLAHIQSDINKINNNLAEINTTLKFMNK